MPPPSSWYPSPKGAFRPPAAEGGASRSAAGSPSEPGGEATDDRPVLGDVARRRRISSGPRERRRADPEDPSPEAPSSLAVRIAAFVLFYWEAVFRLDDRQRRVASRMLLRFAAVPVVERFLSVPDLWRWLDAAGRPGETLSPAELERTVRGILSLRGSPGDQCLRRCQLLFPELRGAGGDVAVCLGVRREEGGGVVGHGWLEMDGRPWREAGDPRDEYRVIYRYPEEGAEGGLVADDPR